MKGASWFLLILVKNSVALEGLLDKPLSFVVVGEDGNYLAK